MLSSGRQGNVCLSERQKISPICMCGVVDDMDVDNGDSLRRDIRDTLRKMYFLQWGMHTV